MNYYQIVLTLVILLTIMMVSLLAIKTLEPTPAIETQSTYPVNVFATDDIKAEFQEIHELPYDVENMNCKHKAGLFVKVLKENKATGIKVMDIGRTDNQGGHEVVLWQDRVYDPTSGIWNMSRTQYIEMIREKGFDGIITEATV